MTKCRIQTQVDMSNCALGRWFSFFQPQFLHQRKGLSSNLEDTILGFFSAAQASPAASPVVTHFTSPLVDEVPFSVSGEISGETPQKTGTEKEGQFNGLCLPYLPPGI